jgi:hypothetical protein
VALTQTHLILVPASERRTTLVQLDRALIIPHITIGLRQVEHRAGVIRMTLNVALQQCGVTFKLLSPSATVSVMLDDKRLEQLLAMRSIASEVFVR